MRVGNKNQLGLTGVGALAIAIAGTPLPGHAASSVATGGDTTPQGGSDSAQPGNLDEVIVTGTRDVGVKARDSASPIEVVTNAQLAATGATNAFDALKSLIPSFSASAQGIDTDTIFRSARLRGMNPGEVLVLVNGKRRHDTAMVNFYESANSPSSPSDLDMIPIGLIDHIEVLLDGAAAQYGSDAVAGVINIILKSSTSEGAANASGGVTSRDDGAQWAGGAFKGFSIGNGGFLDVDVDYHHTSFIYRGGFDVQSFDEVNPSGVHNGPVQDLDWGGPQVNLTTIGANMSIPLNDNVSLYGFATGGHRAAAYYDNDRTDSVAPSIWPNGFTPLTVLEENDGAATIGFKGSVESWDWDVSGTWGTDHVRTGIVDSVNTGLLAATGTSGTTGTLGQFSSTQGTLNADVRRSLSVGLPDPLNVAAGLEFRRENYQVHAGDPVTYDLGGMQAEGGTTPIDASDHSRTVKAAYVDLSTHVLPKWKVDVAGRYEDYSDAGIGSTLTGKLTQRVDFTDRFGLRGTISSGFHAPTLSQEYFSATEVEPLAITLQAPPTSPGARYLGAQPLQPEKSTDISFGVVAEPLEDLHTTLDVYSIQLDHRIIESAGVSGPAALTAAALNDPSFATQGASAFVAFFNNGVNTRTRGLDLTADYKSDLNTYGLLRYALSANFNTTKVTRQYAVPPVMAVALVAQGQPASYINPQVTADITEASPDRKIVLALSWSVGRWDFNLRETYYGVEHGNSGDTSAVVPFADIRIAPAYITDMDVAYAISDRVKVDVGGNNIFDVMPARMSVAEQQPREAELYPYYTPWGNAGAYFYGRVTVKF
jgi:iron complex outermembrane recepter protein